MPRLLLSLLLGLGACAGVASGYRHYAKALPNLERLQLAQGARDLADAQASVAHNIHSLRGGLNAFGSLFLQTKRWTLELCCSDTDGDGWTAGEELGDACCTGRPDYAGPDVTSPSDAAQWPKDRKQGRSHCFVGDPCVGLAGDGVEGAESSRSLPAAAAAAR